MDENLEHKIRNLKLKIMRVEKELSRSLHNVNLGAWLHAGHPSQMAKAGERERKRLESKLAELRAQLEELAPGSTPKPAPPPVDAKPVAPAPPPAPIKAVAVKPKAEAQSAKAVPASKDSTAKKAADKKPAASKSAKTKKKK
jgi:hypothetical protein